MKEKAKNGEERFRILGIVTVIVVYLLVLVGGIVRSTGSGMGCPDWPKCFGNWVPPSHVNELPENYQEIYSLKRAVKNEKFSAYLDFFGFSELADKIRHDESILIENEFNKSKTWTEYFNRLLGATTGFLILATFIGSLIYIKKDKTIPILAFLTLVLVIFQGWTGSIVVSTNLLPWMITFHMLLAIVLLALLIYLVYRATPIVKRKVVKQKGLLQLVLILCLASLVIQIVVGTQVREAIDEIAVAYNFDNRASWIGELSFSFYFHRTFSILVIGLHLWLLYIIWQNSGLEIMKKLAIALFVILGLEVIFGVIMAYFAIPPFAQPLHLLLSTLMFGIQFLLLLMTNNKVALKEVGNKIEDGLVVT